MARGFIRVGDDFGRLLGWELCEVALNKHHVMFWFDGHRGLLDVADCFSYRSADGLIEFKYEIYGPSKSLNVHRILYLPIQNVTVTSKEQLDIRFSNGDVVTIYDNSENKSWWFFRYKIQGEPPRSLIWEISDDDTP